ncbi:MAG: hypothetical protein OQL19_07910 [Gammaproteobacteria bacterium]|nr:hypothetical protein [Gammaproteobacteria bacterium]
MNLKNKSESASVNDLCQFCFGVAGLRNTSLLEHFFPEDLPEDWRLSYYSNEFHLLLMSALDLNLCLSSPQEIKSLAYDEIIEQLELFSDDLEEGFLLLFDTSMFADEVQKKLMNIQEREGNQIYFVNFNCMDKLQEIDTLINIECTEIKMDEKDTQKMSLFCMVSNEKKIEAIELRQLIEQVCKYAFSKHYNSINVIFSSSQYALENCRNAILLESMM